MKTTFHLIPIFLTTLIFFYQKIYANEKFEISGTVLIYDTENVINYDNIGITEGDYEYLRETLAENTSIKTLQLNSIGGLIETAFAMSDLIIDYELDTYVKGECASACTTLLVSGENRIVERGSKVGFHQSSWSADSMRDWYEYNKAYEGWDNVFEFTEWLYKDTQESFYREMQFLIERNVDPLFAIKTLKAESDDMWYPRRKELISSGFITE